MNSAPSIKSVRIERQTRETVFSGELGPRSESGTRIELPNQLLGHMIDHLLKACCLSLDITNVAWPGSWRFDHVLCEDMGQFIGRGVTAIHDALAQSVGVPGRAATTAVMDDALVECVISFEGRSRCDWSVSDGGEVDGFVDSWYDDRGGMVGWASGTNLQQFFEGFAIGAGATVSIVVRKSGNPHHVYESAFRALGDAIGTSLNIAGSRISGDTSGLAGPAKYVVKTIETTNP